ncbi:uncharacterized mitochondrial protein AtMg00310-like [Typha latifolia]|uniref:uncharacterized mitochondrial protein AtMg00310-like n=1 Tax=Typha latifolia TaxID=4733 RepID=UPI003C2F6F7D
MLAIPTFWLSCSWVPETVLEAINKVARAFLWSNGSNKGIYLVSWGKVTQPKREGGLGVRSLQLTGSSLLGKQVFRVLNGEDAIWIKIVNGKYGGLHPWRQGNWRTTSGVWKALYKTARVIRMGCRKLIDDGRDSAAADDPWTSAVPWRWKPRILHSDLLRMELSVAEVLRSRSNSGHNLVGVAGLELAFEIASTTLATSEVKDTWIWWPHTLGIPKPSSIYRFLKPTEEEVWPGWRGLWKLKVAPRVQMFC